VTPGSPGARGFRAAHARPGSRAALGLRGLHDPRVAHVPLAVRVAHGALAVLSTRAARGVHAALSPHAVRGQTHHSAARSREGRQGRRLRGPLPGCYAGGRRARPPHPRSGCGWCDRCGSVRCRANWAGSEPRAPPRQAREADSPRLPQCDSPFPKTSLGKPVPRQPPPLPRTRHHVREPLFYVPCAATTSCN